MRVIDVNYLTPILAINLFYKIVHPTMFTYYFEWAQRHTKKVQCTNSVWKSK